LLTNKDMSLAHRALKIIDQQRSLSSANLKKMLSILNTPQKASVTKEWIKYKGCSE